MLEEGFAGDMETISGQVRPERQVVPEEKRAGFVISTAYWLMV